MNNPANLSEIKIKEVSDVKYVPDQPGIEEIDTERLLCDYVVTHHKSYEVFDRRLDNDFFNSLRNKLVSLYRSLLGTNQKRYVFSLERKGDDAYDMLYWKEEDLELSFYLKNKDYHVEAKVDDYEAYYE